MPRRKRSCAAGKDGARPGTSAGRRGTENLIRRLRRRLPLRGRHHGLPPALRCKSPALMTQAAVLQTHSTDKEDPVSLPRARGRGTAVWRWMRFPPQLCGTCVMDSDGGAPVSDTNAALFSGRRTVFTGAAAPDLCFAFACCLGTDMVPSVRNSRPGHCRAPGSFAHRTSASLSPAANSPQG